MTPPLLPFVHVGPAREKAIAVPPSGIQVSAYSLCFDEQARAIAYCPEPDYHQAGHRWLFDGTAWQQVSSATYRLGSQQQPWRAHWDAVRNAMVHWGWDSSGGAVGVMNDANNALAVLLHEAAIPEVAHMRQ